MTNTSGFITHLKEQESISQCTKMTGMGDVIKIEECGFLCALIIYLREYILVIYFLFYIILQFLSFRTLSRTHYHIPLPYITPTHYHIIPLYHFRVQLSPPLHSQNPIIAFNSI